MGGGVQSISVGPWGSQSGLNSVGGGGVGGGNDGSTVAVGGRDVSGVVSPDALHNGGRVGVSRVSVCSVGVSSVGVSGVGKRGSQRLVDDGSGMSVRGIGNWGSQSLGDDGSLLSVVDSGGSIGGGVGVDGNGGDVLLGGDGLDDGRLLVGLVDGSSLDDVLLDSMGEDGGDDLLAVHDRAALVGHSGGDVVDMLSNLGHVGLLNDGHLGMHLGVGTSGDDVLLHMGDGVAGVAGSDQRGLPVGVVASSGNTSHDGGNNDLEDEWD